MNRFLGRCVVVVSMAALSAGASAATLLLDNFDNGVLGTNPSGVGSGFTLFQGFGSGGTAVESGGVVTTANNGSNVITSIQSNDAINPIGTTMTWVINSSAGPNSNDGIGVGWVKAGDIPCCAAGVFLEFRNDRVTLDFHNGSGSNRPFNFADGNATANAVYNWNNTSAMTAVIELQASTWKVDVTGTTVDIHQSGSYVSGFSINDILTAAGGTTLRAHGNTLREPGGGVFESVLITTVPEPGSVAMLLIGSLGLVLRGRRRMA